MKRLLVGLVVVLCVLMASLAFAQTITTSGGASSEASTVVVPFQSPNTNFNFGAFGGSGFILNDTDSNAVQIGVVASHSSSSASPSAVIASPSSGGGLTSQLLKLQPSA